MPARFPKNPAHFDPPSSDFENTAPETCKLLAADGTCAVYEISSNLIIKCKLYRPGCEVEAVNMEQAYAMQLLVPQLLLSGILDDRFLIIQTRLEGEPLADALPGLNDEDLARIATQVYEHMRHMRVSHTESRMGMLDGRMVVDRRVLAPMPEFEAQERRESIENSDQVRAILGRRLQGKICDRLLAILMRLMPPAEPFTFSHSDLHERNIMVRDGQFVGLIDWKLAGFYPVWWEFVNATPLLYKELQPFSEQSQLFPGEALQWFEVYHAVRDRPDDELTKAKLQRFFGSFGVSECANCDRSTVIQNRTTLVGEMD